jgi:S1-C subfamily serine protease
MRQIRRFLPLHARWWIRWAVVFVALLAFATPAGAQPAPQADAEEAQARALGRAGDAVVGVRTIAVDGAPSNDALGPARQGSGVVIGSDDLMLTIGYLVVEADQVQLLLDDGRELPARVVWPTTPPPASGWCSRWCR